MSTTYDVAVIGAGLAGLQCAAQLASKGRRVLLVDRKPSLTGSVHTTGIFVRKTWEDFPFPPGQLGPAIRDVVLYSPARRALELHAEHDEYRIGRMGWIYLHLLDRCARAGVQWMPSTRLAALDAETITVERHRRSERIAVRYVVGADGARSTVAKLLGLDQNRELLVGVEEVVPPIATKPVLHCYLDPRLAPGYIAWVANDGHEAHVGVAGYRDRFEPSQALELFKASLPFTFGKMIERRGGLIPVGGMLTRIANERGLLVGDAAGAVSPLTAGGLDAALRLSNFAADVITADDPRVLAQYSGERFRARFFARTWMRRLMRVAASAPALELACALVRTPPLRALAEHVFFSRGSFPDARVELVPTEA